jgi:antitoxin ParD1/3/4
MLRREADGRMQMETMTISLPETMREYVEEQVQAGEYGSASEYFRELVRADQKRHAKMQLEQVLLSALGSSGGNESELTPEMLEDVRHRLRERGTQR